MEFLLILPAIAGGGAGCWMELVQAVGWTDQSSPSVSPANGQGDEDCQALPRAADNALLTSEQLEATPTLVVVELVGATLVGDTDTDTDNCGAASSTANGFRIMRQAPCK